MSGKKKALVISAHAADFVWRCGGAIALHQKLGYEVTVVCLSFGEKGESAKLWKQEGMTLEKVKSIRKKEAENAAKELNVHDLIFLEKQSNANLALRLMNLYRRIALSFGLKHVRTIYFVSNTIAKKFDEAYISRANKIVVYNKIQLSNYSLISEDTSPFEKSKDLNICVITGMSPNKNIDYMLSLAQHFHLMDMPITFHLIGVQKSDVRVTYPNILIYENVDEIQKNNILGNSDFLLFPSLEEGFGIPLIEAGVLKIPILCSDITIFREICGSGALFFNPEKIQDCIAKIEGLIKLKQKDQTYTSDTTRKINQFYKKCIKKYVF